MKPVVLPMLHLLCSSQNRDWFSRDVGPLAATDAQDSLELVREDLDEPRDSVGPIVEDPFGATTAGEFRVARYKIFHHFQIARIMQRLKIDRVQVTTLLGEVAALIVNVGDTTAHAGSEITAA